VQAATALARDIGIAARFVMSDVYDAPAAVAHRKFDIVYTGVGALCWLPDIVLWARVVHALLRPGGELYLYEFHPVKWMIEGSAPGTVQIIDSYFTPPEGYREAGGVSYADASIPAAATPTVQWNHPLGEVVTAVAEAGLRIEALRELDHDVLCQWDWMERAEDGFYWMPPDLPSLPLMYVLRARCPA
jgi:SAM-dependent methyltransferase